MKVGGYAGQVLYIDLTKEEVTKEPLDLEMAKKTPGRVRVELQICLGPVGSRSRSLFPGEHHFHGDGADNRHGSACREQEFGDDEMAFHRHDIPWNSRRRFRDQCETLRI